MPLYSNHAGDPFETWEGLQTILGGASAVAAEVEATKAIRGVLRPDDCGRFGCYHIGGNTTNLSTSTAVVDRPWFWCSWASQGHIALIKRIRVSWAIGAITTGTAGIVNIKGWKTAGNFSIPGGGTWLSPNTTKTGGKLRGSMEDSFLYLNINANLAIPTTSEVEANPFGIIESAIGTVGGVTPIKSQHLFEHRQGEIPFILSSYQGFYLSFSHPAATTLPFLGSVDVFWTEMLASDLPSAGG